MKHNALRKLLSPVVEKAMKDTGVPGVSVGIRHEGEEHGFGFGVTSIEHPQPVDEETLFQIGSTTKTFTGTVVMQLVEEGKLDLDAPVVSYLPGFKVADETVSSAVTLRHLLTHTGGWLGDYFDDLGRGNDALRRIVTRMSKRAPQLTPLGSVWSYNNSGFYAAGRVIEAVTRKAYEDVVAEKIFNPLGMDHSFFFAEWAITYKTAVGHARRPEGLTVARPWGLTRSANPAGGIISNVLDQLKYARAHLGHATEEGERILSKASIKEMQKPQAEAGSLADHVGITWLLEDFGRDRIVKHGGTVNGQMSAFALVPKEDFAITVLTNGDRGHEVDHAITSWAYKRLLGLEPARPKTRRLGAKAAADFAGSYRLPYGELVVRPVDGELEAGVQIDEGHPQYENLAAILPPPVRVALTKGDRGVVVSGGADGRRVEFVREETGEVGWIRWGGRIYRRMEPAESSSS